MFFWDGVWSAGDHAWTPALTSLPRGGFSVVVVVVIVDVDVANVADVVCHSLCYPAHQIKCPMSAFFTRVHFTCDSFWGRTGQWNPFVLTEAPSVPFFVRSLRSSHVQPSAEPVRPGEAERAAQLLIRCHVMHRDQFLENTLFLRPSDCISIVNLLKPLVKSWPSDSLCQQLSYFRHNAVRVVFHWLPVKKNASVNIVWLWQESAKATGRLS